MEDPKPTFKYLVERIKELYPDFAYIHIVDPRAEGNRDRIPDPSEVRYISSYMKQARLTKYISQMTS